jgi:6-pyruvoyltetrahydropterin/6-carboxytetrahydropterin synthase
MAQAMSLPKRACGLRSPTFDGKLKLLSGCVDNERNPRMYQIAKQFRFAASHSIPTLPEGHKCKRLHGHTYTVEVILAATDLDEHGFVCDYADLGDLGVYIKDNLDHRHLNDLMPQTSAEAIAEWLHDWAKQRWPHLIAIRVSESPDTWAEYIE